MSSGQEEEVWCGGWRDVFFHEQSLLEVRGGRDGKRCLMGFWIAKVAGVYADGAKGVGVGIAGRGVEGRGWIAGCYHGVIAFWGSSGYSLPHLGLCRHHLLHCIYEKHLRSSELLLLEERALDFECLDCVKCLLVSCGTNNSIFDFLFRLHPTRPRRLLSPSFLAALSVPCIALLSLLALMVANMLSRGG